jgi:hypothetical protein
VFDEVDGKVDPIQFVGERQVDISAAAVHQLQPPPLSLPAGDGAVA